VSIVGNEITETKDVMQKLFSALGDIPVRMVSYGGSRHNISILIPRKHKEQTLQLLNKGLFGLE
jgi:aspartate kinase